MKSAESGPNLSVYLQSALFSKSVNPLNVSQKFTIHALFKVKSVDPGIDSSPSLYYYLGFSVGGGLRQIFHLM